jgi:hypothetical protein
MAIIKLQNEGDEHTMKVAECKTVAGNYGEQVLFSDGTDTLYLPKQSADRQLERLGLDESSVVGMNITFSRDPNPKKGAKPYWGMSYAGTDAEAKMISQHLKTMPRAEPSKPTAPSVSVNVQQRREAIVRDYLMLWQTVATALATTEASAVQAAVATIWISWKDKGIQPDGLPEIKTPEKAPEVKMPAPSGKRLAPPTNDAPPDFSKFPPPTDDDLPFD